MSSALGTDTKVEAVKRFFILIESCNFPDHEIAFQKERQFMVEWVFEVEVLLNRKVDTKYFSWLSFFE